MAAYVALLRAINVGGTGKLAMADLKALCEATGFTKVKTYIQSGNVVFASRLAEAKVKAALEQALVAHMGKPAAAIIRSAAEMTAIIQRNPFARHPPNRVIVTLLDAPAPTDALTGMIAPGGEQARAWDREVFIYFPGGQGASKLKLPLRHQGATRNINTIAKLAEIAATF